MGRRSEKPTAKQILRCPGSSEKGRKIHSRTRLGGKFATVKTRFMKNGIVKTRRAAKRGTVKTGIETLRGE